MKKLLISIALIFVSGLSYSQLDTKLIASKYSKGIVKIILLDPELERSEGGPGYIARGSGFFVTNDGYIFTNRHVVEICVKGYIDYDYRDANGQVRSGFSTYSEDLIADKNFVKAYRVGYATPIVQVFYGNTENDYKLYVAEVVAIGMGAFDGALLKVVKDQDGNTSNLNFTRLPIGDSDKVQQGEQLCVFGYPMQVSGTADLMLRDLNTLSVGIMSGYDYVMNTDYGYIKTDAEIHGGNSGGPVFNEENKVIGIATAKGVATGIGLVGGINGMFFISACDAKAHQQLVALGLKTPQRSFSINTITGARQRIKTADEINAAKGNSPGLVSDADPYKNSVLYFSTISVSENNNKFPEPAQRFNTFTINKKTGGYIWIYVDNYPNAISTSQIVVLVDELKGDDYKKVEDLVFNVSGEFDYTYFKYTFTKKGTYKFTIFSKEMKYINTGTVTINYK